MDNLTDKEHRQIIQNFLNMVCFETQGRGGSSGKLEELLEEYFQEADTYN